LVRGKQNWDNGVVGIIAPVEFHQIAIDIGCAGRKLVVAWGELSDRSSRNESLSSSQARFKGILEVGGVSDRIPGANDLFDNVVTSFGAFNEPVDVVARNEDFPEVCREWKHGEDTVASV